MAITAFKRYEMKFMLPQAQFEALIPKLTLHMKPDEHCKNGDFYHIDNIYYDTFDNSLIRHSLSKPYYKEKLRLRSYQNITSNKEKVFLELKKKIGGIVNKRRTALSLEEAYAFIESGTPPLTKDYMNKQVVNEIEYFLSRNDVNPATYISYRRMAFLGKQDQTLRVTFDSEIRTRRKDLFLEKGSYGEQLLEEGNYLMEVKISDAVPLWLAQVFSDLQIYKTSFSKYGTEYVKTHLNKQANNTEVNFQPKRGVRKPKLCVSY